MLSASPNLCMSLARKQASVALRALSSFQLFVTSEASYMFYYWLIFYTNVCDEFYRQNEQQHTECLCKVWEFVFLGMDDEVSEVNKLVTIFHLPNSASVQYITYMWNVRGSSIGWSKLHTSALFQEVNPDDLLVWRLETTDKPFWF